MQYQTKNKHHQYVVTGLMLLVGVNALLFGLSLHPKHAAAACTPSTSYGIDTLTINVPASGTYTAWARIISPDGTNNQVMMDIDGGTCFTFGKTMAANTWTWVDTSSGTTTPITTSLSAGNHTLVLTGNQPGVGVDRLIFTQDTTCVPNNPPGFNAVTNPVPAPGDNCAPPKDTVPPTVSISAPTGGVTISGTIPFNVTAADNIGGSGMTKVEFYVDGGTTPVNTISSSTGPYNYSWNTTAVANGTHSLTAKAYDVVGNVGTSAAVSVTVNNLPQNPGDCDGDGHVTITDLGIPGSNYLKTGATRAQCDLNGDGIVNIFDFSILAAHMNT